MTEPSTIRTRLTDIYRVRHPFACAGMAFAGTTPALATAVSNAGGIGAVGMGPLPADAVRALVRAVRSGTDRPFNVNFITFMTGDEQIEVCCEERVPIVSFHWGHPPRAFLDRLHGAGVRVWEQVGSVEAGKEAAESGVDAIVAQGAEAGGHNYACLPTFVQVPAIVDAVAPVPVLAAGGVADGRGVAAALALGADGVWVGTRMVASAEANSHPEYRRRLVEARSADAVLSSAFGPEMPEFNPMRVLRGRTVAEWAGRESEIPRDTSSQPEIGTTVLVGERHVLRRFTNFVPVLDTEGDFDEMPLLAGQGVGSIHDVRPAADIVEAMMAEAADILRRLRG